MDNQTASYTGADALNDALLQAGVTHIFLNSGTDYPPIIESWAKCDAEGRAHPRVIISPHETAALSAAQGFAQLTGEAQAVFVHVDVGTQNLGGTVHNAFRCRVPVFLFAGVSPYTIENELPGSRNAQIQFWQNVGDQAGIVRGYTKMAQEYHSAKNIRQLTLRAMQLARSDPKGPVYLMASREVLEEEALAPELDGKLWAPVAPGAADDASIKALAYALMKAERPLVITSYLGRNPASVNRLLYLSQRLAIPVVETYPCYMNFPSSNPLHLGFDSQALIGDADVILALDSDMPWIPALAKPRAGTRVFYLDVDPIKEHIPLWYIPSELFIKADSYTALGQLIEVFEENPGMMNPGAISARRERVTGLHDEMRAKWREQEGMRPEMTSEYLSACVRELIDDDTIVLNETITDSDTVARHIPRGNPGTMFFSGGSSLGWHGGAAVGMKLARPERDVVALTGDGTYIFSCPTAVHWMARKYGAPFMTVIYNNSGWNAPKQITMGQHPGGYAEKLGDFHTSFDPSARLDLIAEAAGGAFARTVSDPKELKTVLAEGWDAVKGGRAAVINVLLQKV